MEIAIRLLADGLMLPIALLAIWALLKIPNQAKYDAYARMLMAGLTAYLAAKLIASVYQPELARPFEKMGVEAVASSLNNPGFPSDHALFSMVIVLAVWFESGRKKLAALLFGLTLLVGLGRILGLVHTPLDVLGGLVIACAGIPWYLQRKDKQHSIPENSALRKKPVE